MNTIKNKQIKYLGSETMKEKNDLYDTEAIEEISFNCVATETKKATKQYKLLSKKELDKKYNKILLESGIERL